MNKFNKHHLMDVKEVCEYVKIKHKLFKPEEELFCEEIGDGNINYIFKVTSMQSGKSVVIKQADKFLRSSGRPLDLNRNRIEAEVCSFSVNMQNLLFLRFILMMMLCVRW